MATLESAHVSMADRIRSSAPRRLVVPVALLAAASTLTACGGSSDTAGPAKGGKMTLSIAEPASGATVNTPFTVKVNTNAKLGTTDSGNDHIHVYFDNNSNDYLKVYSASGQVTTVPHVTPGQHTLHVSLRKADHSPAGAEAQIPVMVAKGNSSGSNPAPTTTSGSGGGGGGAYGY